MESQTSLRSQKSLFQPGTNDGLSDFMRNYSQRSFGVDVVSTSGEGDQARKILTPTRKAKYRANNVRAAKSEFVDACCPAPKRRTCCPKAKKRPCCPPSPSCCPKKRRRTCPPKPSCPKPRCQPKPKPKACCPVKRKPRCRPSCPKPRPKPCCAKKRRKCPVKCASLVPTSNNGYLNFVRAFRQRNSQLEPSELVSRAARAWCRLPEDKKNEFRRQAGEVVDDKSPPKKQTE